MNSDMRHFEHEVSLDQCPACESKNIKPYIVSSDYHYGIDGNFSTSRCDDCHTAFMNPMPSASDLGKLYPDDYYSYQVPNVESLTRRMVRTLLRYPRQYTLPHFKTPGTMLDVGCGSGHYLLEMQRRGWTVYGAELSRGAVEAGKKAGLDIRAGELAEAKFENGMFDFVRSNHSFEHISDPDSTLLEIKRILKNDGKLFIGVPNFDGMWPSLFKQHWWNFGLPVHTFNYSQEGLSAALKRNGFKVEKIAHNSDYSGLLGSMQIQRNAKNGEHRSDGSILSSKIARFPAHYLSKLMDVIGRGDCIEVIASKA